MLGLVSVTSAAAAISHDVIRIVLLRWRGSGAFAVGQHDDLRPRWNVLVEVDHILIDQADAAAGHVLPDAGGIVGPMNAGERVAPVLEQVERSRSEGVG